MSRTRRLPPRAADRPARERRRSSSSASAGSWLTGRSWTFDRRDLTAPDPSSSRPNSRGGAAGPGALRRPRPPSRSRPEPGPLSRGPRCGPARRSGADERNASPPRSAVLRPDPVAGRSSPGAQGARGAGGGPAVREPGSVLGRAGRAAVSGPARISAGCSGQGLGPNLGSARGPNLLSCPGPEPGRVPVSRPNTGPDRAPGPRPRPGSAWRARRLPLAGSSRAGAGGADSGAEGAGPAVGARRRPGSGSMPWPALRPGSVPGPGSAWEPKPRRGSAPGSRRTSAPAAPKGPAPLRYGSAPRLRPGMGRPVTRRSRRVSSAGPRLWSGHESTPASQLRSRPPATRGSGPASQRGSPPPAIRGLRLARGSRPPGALLGPDARLGRGRPFQPGSPPGPGSPRSKPSARPGSMERPSTGRCPPGC